MRCTGLVRVVVLGRGAAHENVTHQTVPGPVERVHVPGVQGLGIAVDHDVTQAGARYLGEPAQGVPQREMTRLTRLAQDAIDLVFVQARARDLQARCPAQWYERDLQQRGPLDVADRGDRGVHGGHAVADLAGHHTHTVGLGLETLGLVDDPVGHRRTEALQHHGHAVAERRDHLLADLGLDRRAVAFGLESEQLPEQLGIHRRAPHLRDHLCEVRGLGPPHSHVQVFGVLDPEQHADQRPYRTVLGVHPELISRHSFLLSIPQLG